jgi:predicted nuclease with TOPRIM domain
MSYDTVPFSADPEVSYDELNDKIDKCQNTLDMISSEKELLAQTNRNLAGEINNLKSKIAAAKCKHISLYKNE